MQIGSDSLIIKTFEVDEAHEIKGLMDRLAKELSELLIEKGLSEEDVRNSKLMSVIPKSADHNNQSNLVKNKFVITENPKIWEELLIISKNGNN